MVHLATVWIDDHIAPLRRHHRNAAQLAGGSCTNGLPRQEPEDEVSISRREKAKARQEPVIKGVLPDQPAPVAAPRPAPETAVPVPAAVPAPAVPAWGAEVARPAPG